MNLRKIAVLGAGPGGLYAARLLKISHPQARVEVFEQSQAGSTFGFGVGIAAGTQRNLNNADPESLQAILDASWVHEMSMKVGGRVVHLPQDNLRSIARTTLLSTLADHARNAGVIVHYGSRTSIDSLDADVIVAADGINSVTREQLADQVEPSIDLGRSYYLWCGTDFVLPRAIFAPAHTEHGTFVAHAYPYAADRSTFLIETGEATWAASGFDRTTEQTPPTETDENSLRYLEEVFADELGGHRLIGNRTRWTRFRTVTCQKWSSANVVLLGDAVHTAHYSIGSGTKLAMEDAIALDTALREHDSVEAAFAAYEATRRPAVEHLQEIARRSASWWDAFPYRLDLPVESLLMSYMTRAGKISVERFALSAPQLARDALSFYGHQDAGTVSDEHLGEWILSRAATVNGTDFDGRVVSRADFGDVTSVEVDLDEAWSPEGDAILSRIGEAHSPQVVFWLHGSSQRSRLLTRLDFAERIRLTFGNPVVVEGSVHHLADLTAGLASMRTTFVAIADEDAQPEISATDRENLAAGLEERMAAAPH